MRIYVESDRGRPLRRYPIEMLERMLVAAIGGGAETERRLEEAWGVCMRKIQSFTEKEIRKHG